MAFSVQAMEDDREQTAGPNFGPPIVQGYQRELEPDVDDLWDAQQLDWWCQIYVTHALEVSEYQHAAEWCSWCDAIVNVRNAYPDREEPLMRVVLRYAATYPDLA